MVRQAPENDDSPAPAGIAGAGETPGEHKAKPDTKPDTRAATPHERNRMARILRQRAKAAQKEMQAAKKEEETARKNAETAEKGAEDATKLAEEAVKAATAAAEAFSRAQGDEKRKAKRSGDAQENEASRARELRDAQATRRETESDRDAAIGVREQSERAYNNAAKDHEESMERWTAAVRERTQAQQQEDTAKGILQRKSNEYEDAKRLENRYRGLDNVRDALERLETSIGTYNVDYTDESDATVHLLDGGISDNLGLTPLLELLQLVVSLRRDEQARDRIDQLVRHLVVVVVDAGAKSTTMYGARRSPPGLISTLNTAVGASIDSKSLLLRNNLEQLRADLKAVGIAMSLIYVGFEEIGKLGTNGEDNDSSIDYDACEKWYNAIPTNWRLSTIQVNRLVEAGGAILRRSKEFRAFLDDNEITMQPGKTLEDVCEAVANART